MTWICKFEMLFHQPPWNKSCHIDLLWGQLTPPNVHNMTKWCHWKFSMYMCCLGICWLLSFRNIVEQICCFSSKWSIVFFKKSCPRDIRKHSSLISKSSQGRHIIELKYPHKLGAKLPFAWTSPSLYWWFAKEQTPKKNTSPETKMKSTNTMWRAPVHLHQQRYRYIYLRVGLLSIEVTKCSVSNTHQVKQHMHLSANRMDIQFSVV